jgi:hypothetical protein
VCFTQKINRKKACYAQQSKRKAIRGVCKYGIESIGEAQTVEGICESLNSDVIEDESLLNAIQYFKWSGLLSEK